jgi:hypothetical protein
MLNGRPLRSYQGAASGVEIADLSEQHEFTPGFRGMRVAQTWIFSVNAHMGQWVKSELTEI